MGKATKIQWTDHTFNGWRGCDEDSPGCDNCYARTMSLRNPAVLGVWGEFGTRVVAVQKQWDLLNTYQKSAIAGGERQRVFCHSLSDVFEDFKGAMITPKGDPYWWCHGSLSNNPLPMGELPEGCKLATMGDMRRRLFDSIDDCPDLNFQLVTKRPQNVRGLGMWPGGYRDNVWILASVEDQAAAERRIPELLLCRSLCPVLGLSVEPLIGPLDLTPWIDQLDWVIVGGESGHSARPCNLKWIHDVLIQCQAADVPCYVKQLGTKPYVNRANPNAPTFDDEKHYFKLKDSHGGDPDEWAPSFNIWEFPA